MSRNFGPKNGRWAWAVRAADASLATERRS